MVSRPLPLFSTLGRPAAPRARSITSSCSRLVVFDPSPGFLEESAEVRGDDQNLASMWQSGQQQSEWRNPYHPFWGNYQRQQQQQQQWRNQNQDWHEFPRELLPASSPRYIGDGTRRSPQGAGARAAFDPNRNRYWNQRDNRHWQHGRFVRLDDTRKWLHSKETNDYTSREKFMFLSYNILAADNAREHYRELYYHIPMRYVRWDWRKVRLLQEIEYWSPDILCLQEVDRFAELQTELVKKGYAGTFKRRTGTAADGCAIFWRQTRFQLLQEESIDYKDYGLRDNIGQLCVLRSTKEAALEGEISTVENQIVVVANTHILFNPKRGDIKLGQVRTLLTVARELSSCWGGAQVIVAGDFNSTPSSPLYRYISTAELDVSSLDRRSISGQVAEGEGGYYQNSSPKPWIRKKVFNTVVETAAAAQALKWVAKREVETTGEAVASTSCSTELMVIKKVTDSLVAQISSTEAVVEAEALTTSIREVHFEEEGAAETEITESREVEDESDTNSPERVELPSGWTAEELVNATGTPSSTKVFHDLTLSSAYPRIEGNAGTRDAQGEPLATTYHKKFRGTVDYIWHTEGLRPVRLVDMLPLDVLRSTGGLPSQKWGSDHLALVCEMEFCS